MSARVLVPGADSLGECALWCDREQALYWTDIDEARLSRWQAGDGQVRHWALPDRLGSFALCERPGRLLLGLASGIAMFDLSSGQVGRVTAVEAQEPRTRINDGRCDPQGRFVFGMFNPQGLRIGGFYRVGPDLAVERLPLPPAHVANAICFSPDGCTLYFTDSPSRQLWQLDYHADGRLGEPRPFARLRDEDGEPDGAAVDAQGGVWTALWGAGCVIRLDPLGRETLRLPLPARQPTCPVFGGQTLDRLFVTSARKQCEDQPLAGAVFELDPAGLRGLPRPSFSYTLNAAPPSPTPGTMKPVTTRLFGHLPDGRPVHEYTLAADQGLSLSAISYGGIVTRLTLPDADGRPVNLVLGFAGLDDYVQRNPHFGTIVGRYGNRIAGAGFELDGQRHQLSVNDGPNCLHGGAAGFGHQLWQVQPEGDDCLCLRLDSPHGDQGFPGRLQVTVRYRLVDALSWEIEYEARTDRPTVLNLTHHDYFNLAGQGTVLAHELQIPAQRYCEVDAHLIPSALAPVAGTPFDFRQPQVIAARLRQGHAQLGLAKGYDHNWLLDSPPDASGLRLAARLRDPASGRVMDVLSTEPALQFYSGNFLDGSLLGSGGAYYRQGDGLCLETQHSPDSPHHDHSPDWPSTVLRPGQTYRSRTLHRFIMGR